MKLPLSTCICFVVSDTIWYSILKPTSDNCWEYVYCDAWYSIKRSFQTSILINVGTPVVNKVEEILVQIK